MNVIVSPYNTNWQEAYTTEEIKLLDIFGENLVAIHHIGSTAVIGLAAKPIIDIMPVVYDLSEVDKCQRQFEQLGYEYMGEFGIDGRRYMRKGGDNRTHQLHVFDDSNILAVERHLAFRDYLRAHSDVAELYGQLKTKLAQQFPTDIDGYCEGKDEFVKLHEKLALEWYRNNKT